MTTSVFVKLQRTSVFVCICIFLFYSCQNDDDGAKEPDPVVETFISDFPANDGLFVAENGTIYASDFGTFDNDTGMGNGTQIFKVSPEGAISEKANGFVAPMGGVIDSEGNFYFTHENEGVSGELVQISPDGSATTIAEIEGWPSGLTIDEDDTIYIANFITPNIHKISPDRTLSIYASDPRLAGCVGIDLDDDGNVITANFNNGDVLKVNHEAEVSLLASIPDVVQNFGIGYMTIFEDYIYATGIGNHVIYRVSLEGDIDIFAGNGTNDNVDGALDIASFSFPNGIAADNNRRILYISQFGIPSLRKIQF